jgi:hypothetical protein
MHESAGRSDLDGPRELVENVTIGVSLSRRRNFPSVAVLEIFSDSLYPIGEAFNFRRSFFWEANLSFGGRSRGLLKALSLSSQAPHS